MCIIQVNVPHLHKAGNNKSFIKVVLCCGHDDTVNDKKGFDLVPEIRFLVSVPSLFSSSTKYPNVFAAGGFAL